MKFEVVVSRFMMQKKKLDEHVTAGLRILHVRAERLVIRYTTSYCVGMKFDLKTDVSSDRHKSLSPQNIKRRCVCRLLRYSLYADVTSFS